MNYFIPIKISLHQPHRGFFMGLRYCIPLLSEMIVHSYPFEWNR